MFICSSFVGMYATLCICSCVCACLFVRMDVCECVRVYAYVCLYVRMYVCVCMYACMYVCMCICTYVYVHMYVCVYTFRSYPINTNSSDVKISSAATIDRSTYTSAYPTTDISIYLSSRFSFICLSFYVCIYPVILIFPSLFETIAPSISVSASLNSLLKCSSVFCSVAFS